VQDVRRLKGSIGEAAAPRMVLLPLLLLLGLLFPEPAWAETIRVTTWNLEWFPSGVANRRLPKVEARRIEEAARVIAILNPDVLLLQEVRDWDACQKLTEAIDAFCAGAASPPLRFEVAVCSAFKEGNVLGWQQTAILSKAPAQAAWSSEWTTSGAVDPPRGYSFALLRIGGKDLGFYSVHLKSNLVRGNGARERQLNILKRELSAEQLIAHTDALPKDFPDGIQGFVIGGDLNTNRDEFVSERTLSILEEAGFTDSFAGVPFASRITHPAKGGYPDTTFDYLFLKGLRPLAPPEILSTKVSDHLPVTCELALPP
jgi:endonuclease/exonuclease/phosphatase family metal-dependent hydrolase